MADKKSFFEIKAFSAKQMVLVIIIIGGSLVGCGYAINSIDNRVDDNKKSSHSNTELILKLVEKIEEDKKEIYKELARNSVSDRAVSYRIGSAQQKRVDKMEEILTTLVKATSSSEIHQKYMAKGQDELKSMVKELQKKKSP